MGKICRYWPSQKFCLQYVLRFSTKIYIIQSSSIYFALGCMNGLVQCFPINSPLALVIAYAYHSEGTAFSSISKCNISETHLHFTMYIYPSLAKNTLFLSAPRMNSKLFHHLQLFSTLHANPWAFHINRHSSAKVGLCSYQLDLCIGYPLLLLHKGTVLSSGLWR